ncbi:molybdopterin-guanine dinucleotide biosynthesis protein B [Staphylococcus succinus]|uniref:molybdopterin-guanine dinucleotide biosynthesis protein B n=1 Tax=Staphylococcus succinus TaxID=61015 RepID=UPI000B0E7BEA|nr:molybdopterin-guanine dinucleotide biosynthesis protein B [Staphylococcus succinus]MBU0438172.1 molybdopterin-guanine dinucleotide biosynthesis protein B [Staphylococcus succinus]PTJ81835.1 molybdopterin-guanine dinucleotide biosynthesis protein B [Staphylococcus succinus]
MILQIVGYKNTGKTTLMMHTVQFLKSQGFNIATIKHHGHDMDDITLQSDDVDHMKHFQAGADQSIVQGTSYQQSVTRKYKQSLDEIINESVTIETNLILVEGFKEANFDKVLVYRDKSELNVLEYLTNIQYRISLDEVDALPKYEQWLLSFFNIEGMN